MQVVLGSDGTSSVPTAVVATMARPGPGEFVQDTDEQIAARFTAGDAAAFGELMQRHMGAVFGVAYGVLHDRDDAADVTQDENGVWHIKAGARVRVRLTMVADTRRYHVALADPLPAGLEILNPSLAVSGSVPQDPASPDYRYGWWWWGTWFNHQNLRDERAEAFTPLLWEGVYTYTYVTRATTPGTFIVPPAKAEEMYSPEVFGRSASILVIVE